MIVKVKDKEILLDENLLKFDEMTINEFLKKFASHYNYYQNLYAEAQDYHSACENEYDRFYSMKFRFYKESGSTDKMAENCTKSDEELQVYLTNLREAKKNMSLLNGFLRSLDRCHDDAFQFCYNLRKELDRIYPYFDKKITD